MQFQWSDKYSVNVRHFDYQHHKILELFNEIAENLESNPDFYEYDYLFEELREYSNYHFQSEEKILIKMGFSLIEKHQIQNHNFLGKIDEFHEKFRKNNAFLILMIMINSKRSDYYEI